MAENMKYKILRWNGKYGEDARFIVEDMSTHEQSLFTPGETEDLAWTHSTLVDAPEFKHWQEFGNEMIEDLEDVAF